MLHSAQCQCSTCSSFVTLSCTTFIDINTSTACCTQRSASAVPAHPLWHSLAPPYIPLGVTLHKQQATICHQFRTVPHSLSHLLFLDTQYKGAVLPPRFLTVDIGKLIPVTHMKTTYLNILNWKCNQCAIATDKSLLESPCLPCNLRQQAVRRYVRRGASSMVLLLLIVLLN